MERVLLQLNFKTTLHSVLSWFAPFFVLLLILVRFFLLYVRFVQLYVCSSVKFWSVCLFCPVSPNLCLGCPTFDSFVIFYSVCLFCPVLHVLFYMCCFKCPVLHSCCTFVLSVFSGLYVMANALSVLSYFLSVFSVCT